MEICDKVGNSSSNAKECLRSILRRLQNPDPHIVLQAITLLDACVSNCGKTFQLEIASRDFETELRKLLSKWTGANQSKVAERLKQLIKKWAEGEFKSDPQLSLIPSLYTKLRLEGIDFSTPPDSATRMNRQAPADPDAVSSQQEVEDIAKAIELSFYSSTTSSTASLYPSVSGALSTPSGSTSGSGVVEPRKVRALYDFEAAEDNELTFIAGEIVHVLDDSDANWWKGRNQRGEGLFPANFVTSDLTVNVEKPKTEKKGVQFNEAVEVKTIKVAQQVEIDEGKIDRLLHLLHEADPNDGQEDSDELLVLEEEVNSMGPLIDTELERVDRKHAQLTQVSSGLVEALNLYHTLMREPPPHGGPPPQFHKPPPPVYGPPPPHPHQVKMFLSLLLLLMPTLLI
ncbi:hypothetical protein AAG570_001889 [Ranatra chinensis]|uniref:Signal transducing adapter molecule 1 n=1 Tax=Ranatra chinensis TaxID=642074 RepID=A0ABD0YAM7_9HEMI